MPNPYKTCKALILWHNTLLLRLTDTQVACWYYYNKLHTNLCQLLFNIIHHFLILQFVKKLSNKFSIEQIAEMLEIDISEVEKIIKEIAK